MEEIPGVTLKITKATGTIKLNIPAPSGMIKLSGDMRRIDGKIYCPQVVSYLSRPTLNNL